MRLRLQHRLPSIGFSLSHILHNLKKESPAYRHRFDLSPYAPPCIDLSGHHIDMSANRRQMPADKQIKRDFENMSTERKIEQAGQGVSSILKGASQYHKRIISRRYLKDNRR